MTHICNVFRADRSFEKYNVLKSNRPDLPIDRNVVGGGCLIGLKNNIFAITLNAWEDECLFDTVWIKINTSNNSKIFINTVYIPPWANSEQKESYYNQLIDIINLREPFARLIILGDFNESIDWLLFDGYCSAVSYVGRTANILLNTLNVSNLKQWNGIKNDSHNHTLDLIISNVAIHVQRTNGLIPMDTSHPPLFFTFDKSDIKFLVSKKSIKLNFFKTNYNILNDKLRLIDWNLEFDGLNIDQMASKLYDILNTLLWQYCPKIIPKSDEFPKWFSRDLIQMIKDKNYYRR